VASSTPYLRQAYSGKKAPPLNSGSVERGEEVRVRGHMDDIWFEMGKASRGF